MRKPKKEMKMTYKVVLEKQESGYAIDEAFDILFDEVFKLFQPETTIQYA